MAEITEVEVGPETARRYREAGSDERREAAQAASDQLLSLERQEPAANLLAAMDKIGRETAARGFTSEGLADILGDDFSPGELERIFGEEP